MVLCSFSVELTAISEGDEPWPIISRAFAFTPGIGIDRLGNSDLFYIGPGAPGVVVDPGGSNGPGPSGGTYRDSEARLNARLSAFAFTLTMRKTGSSQSYRLI